MHVAAGTRISSSQVDPTISKSSGWSPKMLTNSWPLVFPVFVTVIVCGAVGIPIATCPKSIGSGAASKNRFFGIVVVVVVVGRGVPLPGGSVVVVVVTAGGIVGPVADLPIRVPVAEIGS